MREKQNPYNIGSEIRLEEQFFDRDDIVDWVIMELSDPSISALVLHGQRRVGKTSLLLQLKRKLPPDLFRPFYFNLEYKAELDLGEVLAELANEIAKQVGLDLPEDKSFDNRGQYFIDTFLPELFSTLPEECRPVLLIDEFDVLDQLFEEALAETAATKAWFPFVRRLMSEAPRVAFVFVVGRRVDDLGKDYTQILKASLPKEVWVLDRPSSERLVRQAEQQGTLVFTDAAVERILDLTSSHAYLTQLLCHRLWSHAHLEDSVEPLTIDAAEVDAVVDDALRAGEIGLEWIWNGLGPAEMIAAAALAGMLEEGDTVSKDDVVRVLYDYSGRLHTQEVEDSPDDLYRRRVLEKVGDEDYRFAIELFRRWVLSTKELKDVVNQIDRLYPLADKIYEVGCVAYNEYKWEEAIRQFQKALDENPQHFGARKKLGEALLKEGRAGEAIDHLLQAYDLDRSATRGALTRAFVDHSTAVRQSGGEEAALQILEEALEYFPDEQSIIDIYTTLWERQGEAAIEEGGLPPRFVPLAKLDSMAPEREMTPV